MKTQFLEKISNLKQIKLNEHTIMAVLAVIVGTAGGYGAVAFRYLIGFFQSLGYGGKKDLLELVVNLSWPYRVGIPIIGGLIVGPMVYFFAREAKGHGVPEVMEAIALKGGVIRKRVVVVKTLASAICIGSGRWINPGPVFKSFGRSNAYSGRLWGCRRHCRNV